MSLDTRAMPQAEMASVQTAAPAPTTLEKDNLKLIKGIGPAIEKKLNNAGIQTFAALAQLNRQDLENILGSQINRLQDENDLIKQAKKLSRQQGNLP
jgi:large subunit ribosomal protein L21